MPETPGGGTPGDAGSEAGGRGEGGGVEIASLYASVSADTSSAESNLANLSAVAQRTADSVSASAAKTSNANFNPQTARSVADLAATRAAFDSASGAAKGYLNTLAQ